MADNRALKIAGLSALGVLGLGGLGYGIYRLTKGKGSVPKRYNAYVQPPEMSAHYAEQLADRNILKNQVESGYLPAIQGRVDPNLLEVNTPRDLHMYGGQMADAAVALFGYGMKGKSMDLVNAPTPWLKLLKWGAAARQPGGILHHIVRHMRHGPTTLLGTESEVVGRHPHMGQYFDDFGDKRPRYWNRHASLSYYRDFGAPTYGTVTRDMDPASDFRSIAYLYEAGRHTTSLMSPAHRQRIIDIGKRVAAQLTAAGNERLLRASARQIRMWPWYAPPDALEAEPWEIAEADRAQRICATRMLFDNRVTPGGAMVFGPNIPPAAIMSGQSLLPYYDAFSKEATATEQEILDHLLAIGPAPFVVEYGVMMAQARILRRFFVPGLEDGKDVQVGLFIASSLGPAFLRFVGAAVSSDSDRQKVDQQLTAMGESGVGGKGEESLRTGRVGFLMSLIGLGVSVATTVGSLVAKEVAANKSVDQVYELIGPTMKSVAEKLYGNHWYKLPSFRYDLIEPVERMIDHHAPTFQLMYRDDVSPKLPQLPAFMYELGGGGEFDWPIDDDDDIGLGTKLGQN